MRSGRLLAGPAACSWRAARVRRNRQAARARPSVTISDALVGDPALIEEFEQRVDEVVRVFSGRLP